MAAFRQRNNKWQARILRDGHPPEVKTFAARLEAEQWARSVESAMDKGQFASVTEAQRTTLEDLLLRYVLEVTPTMKSVNEDTIRLTAMARKPIAKWSLMNLNSTRVAAFRDLRLKEVSPGTVIRELAYISAIINHARREWGINTPNPVTLVKKPPSSQGRSRILSPSERVLLLDALEPTGRRSIWMKPIVMLALETAMRRGELLALRWEHINFERQTALLLTTKNGEARTVPLSKAALKVMQQLPRCITGVVFPIQPLTLHAAFKRAVARSGLPNLRFHDLRHTAITAIADKLPNIIELSAVSGHKSLAMLKRYYHPDATALALKLG